MSANAYLTWPMFSLSLSFSLSSLAVLPTRMAPPKKRETRSTKKVAKEASKEAKVAAKDAEAAEKLEAAEAKLEALTQQLDMVAPTSKAEINTFVRGAGHVIRPKMSRKTKYIENEVHGKEVTGEFYDHKFSAESRARMGDGHKQLWVKTFQPLVVRAFNTVRSDIQGSIRTAYMGWAIKYPV